MWYEYLVCWLLPDRRKTLHRLCVRHLQFQTELLSNDQLINYFLIAFTCVITKKKVWTGSPSLYSFCKSSSIALKVASFSSDIVSNQYGDLQTTKISRMGCGGGEGRVESAQHITHAAPKDLFCKVQKWSEMIFCNILGKIMVWWILLGDHFVSKNWCQVKKTWINLW